MKAKKYDLFKNLKRKFILTATLSSFAVILVAFFAIYLIVSHNITERPPIKFPPRSSADTNHPNMPDSSETTTPNSFKTTPDDSSTNDEFEQRLRDDRQKSLEALLITLIITGISIEALVIIVSFYFAEKSVKPVREAYETQKTFIANASHEIKTPLAVIQANLEAADIKGNRWIDNVAKKAEDLAILNDQLLTLARMEAMPNAKTTKSQTEKIKLFTFVSEIANCYIPKLNHKKATLKFAEKTKRLYGFKPY